MTTGEVKNTFTTVFSFLVYCLNFFPISHIFIYRLALYL